MRITSPRQAVLLAIRMEESAIQLYERISMMMENSTSACARRLCRDERSHLNRFTALLDTLPTQKEEPEFSPNETSQELLTDTMGENLLFPGGLTAAARKGALEGCLPLLQSAMDAERRSIEFYHLAAGDASLNGETRSIFQNIALQEEEHLREWQDHLETNEENNVF